MVAAVLWPHRAVGSGAGKDTWALQWLYEPWTLSLLLGRTVSVSLLPALWLEQDVEVPLRKGVEVTGTMGRMNFHIEKGFYASKYITGPCPWPGNPLP